ncbi:MAG: hypothetical protein WCC10_03660 [Tumebacillaceae bacterium]
MYHALADECISGCANASRDLSNGQAYVTDTGTVYQDSQKLLGMLQFTGLLLSSLLLIMSRR